MIHDDGTGSTRFARARRRTALVALTLAAAFVVGISAPASASEGQWWYDTYQVENNHAEGWTGEGVKIAVIDEQINPDLPVFAGADLTVDPEALCVGRSATTSEFTTGSRHGSTVTALLIGNGEGAAGIRGIAPDAEVVFYGYGPEPEGSEKDTCEVPPAADPSVTALGWGIRQAIDDGADIISVSVGFSPLIGDDVIVAEALARGIVIVGSVYNGGLSLLESKSYPWGYRGVIAVNAMNEARELPIDTNYGIPHRVSGTTVVAAGVDISVLGADGSWDQTALGSGASFSAPLVAGMLAATSQKYPDATGNQLIQSLIHNTGAEDHPLEFDDSDGFGYGLASFSHLLGVDPTQYDDTNPLLDKSYAVGGGDRPSDERLAAAYAAIDPAPVGDPDEAGTPPPAAAGPPILLIIGIAVAVLLILGVVTALIVIRNNRTHRSGSLQ